MTVARASLAHTAVELAPRLLGAVLVSRHEAEVAVRLSEVEAYEGPDDPASHAYRGRTARNAVMFGPAGYLYVYFTYGMHWCANIVCGPDDRPSAVLLRAGEIVRGVEAAYARRPGVRASVDLARGPARLARCLGLDAADYGIDLCRVGSVVELESMPDPPAAPIGTGGRVGVASAADRSWRFWLDGDPTVSAYRPGARRRRTATRQTGRP